MWSWTVKLSKILICVGLIMLSLCFILLNDQDPVLIESLESKTVKGNPLFNKIYYKGEKEKDVWLMEQSHQGLKSKAHLWDRIAIVVDKAKKPYKAKFMQLEPGMDKISLNLKPINLRATCYMCHSNGPRVIRPNFLSRQVKVSYWDRARLGLWNLKIKTYGVMTSGAVEFDKPFKYTHPAANKKLEIKSCTYCHNDRGFLGRNYLTKQNFIAIKFMVENRIMPPPGFSINEEDRKILEQFANLKASKR